MFKQHYTIDAIVTCFKSPFQVNRIDPQTSLHALLAPLQHYATVAIRLSPARLSRAKVGWLV